MDVVLIARTLGGHDNIIDGDMDELHKESNESHYAKSNCCGHSYFLEFCKKIV